MNKYIFFKKKYKNSTCQSIQEDINKLRKENKNKATGKQYFTKDKNGNKVFAAVETDGFSKRKNGDIVKLCNDDNDYGELRYGYLIIGCNICKNGGNCGYECGSYGDYLNEFYVYRTHRPESNCRMKNNNEIELIKKANKYR